MTRRTTSLLVAGMLLVSLVGVAVIMPMPFVIESPGLTEDTLGTVRGEPVIDVRGAKTYPTTGRLDLTTVSVTSAGFSPRLADVLTAWVSEEQIVLPRDIVYPPDQTVQQVQRTNRRDMVTSQDAAVAAGLRQAGIEPFAVEVAEVVEGAPAEGALRAGDLIRSVDGDPVGTPQDLIDAIRGVRPGDEVRLGIERDGDAQAVQLTTEADPESPDTARIGVAPRAEPSFAPPIEVDIELGEQIGGPSAGMVFSLAIYDLLTPGDLLGGRYVAGTGTIEPDGTVGAIGGIQQKIVGAYKDGDGATVFLVPADNCAAAAESDLADELLLVRVAALDDAVQALEDINAGSREELTLCGD